MKWIAVILVLWILAWGSSERVVAQSVLDQEFDPTPTTLNSGISGAIDKAQTLTVGISGELAQVDVWILRQAVQPNDDLVFDIRATVAGVPIEDDSQTLASIVIPASSVPTTAGFFSLDVSTFGISVAAGDILAIVLRDLGDLGTDYLWQGQIVDPYPGGGLWVPKTRSA